MVTQWEESRALASLVGVAEWTMVGPLKWGGVKFNEIQTSVLDALDCKRL